MDFADVISEAVRTSHSIEIVPRYLLPPECQDKGWCQIDEVLGISQKTLVLKFTEMCSCLDVASSPSSTTLAIIATHDNLKALNARKRMCLTNSIDPIEEFRFVTVLLKSHLYKHSKSSMLWHHRRWLILNFTVLQTSVQDEFEVVELAAVHHPKNYYAWAYMRWWCEWSSISGTERGTLCDLTKSLCLKNLADVSMWTFLHWLSEDELETVASLTNKEFPGHKAIMAAKRIPKPVN